MMKSNSTAFILLAGGSSLRMGGDANKKELLPLNNGLNALQNIVSVLNESSQVNHLHVVYSLDHKNEILQSVRNYKGKLTSSLGGQSRQMSVFGALQSLQMDAPQYVLIHDGARAWLSKSLLDRTVACLNTCLAVVPIIPLVDSLKRIDRFNNIIEECDRSQYALSQTPQGFVFTKIMQAHQALQHSSYSDDSSLYFAYYGEHAQLILGDTANRKITFKEDVLC